MDIKHIVRLSWFSRKGESHEQDGERLRRAHRAGESSLRRSCHGLHVFLGLLGRLMARIWWTAVLLSDATAE
jgi:hypothetical protein